MIQTANMYTYNAGQPNSKPLFADKESMGKFSINIANMPSKTSFNNCLLPLTVFINKY